MGAAAAVEYTNNISSTSETQGGTPDDSANTETNSSLTGFLRRRSLSLLSSGDSSRRPSTNSIPSSTEPRVEVVKAHLLNVPVYERHPFADYKFQRKLGE